MKFSKKSFGFIHFPRRLVHPHLATPHSWHGFHRTHGHPVFRSGARGVLCRNQTWQLGDLAPTWSRTTSHENQITPPKKKYITNFLFSNLFQMAVCFFFWGGGCKSSQWSSTFYTTPGFEFIVAGNRMIATTQSIVCLPPSDSHVCFMVGSMLQFAPSNKDDMSLCICFRFPTSLWLSIHLTLICSERSTVKPPQKSDEISTNMFAKKLMFGFGPKRRVTSWRWYSFKLTGLKGLNFCASWDFSTCFQYANLLRWDFRVPKASSSPSSGYFKAWGCQRFDWKSNVKLTEDCLTSPIFINFLEHNLAILHIRHIQEETYEWQTSKKPMHLVTF